MNSIIAMAFLTGATMSAIARVCPENHCLRTAYLNGDAEQQPCAFADCGDFSVYPSRIVDPWRPTGAQLRVPSKMDVSVANRFVGVSFVQTATMGWLVLEESIALLGIAITPVVILGCVLIARLVLL